MKPDKKSLKIVTIFLIILLLSAAGYFIFKKYTSKTENAATVGAPGTEGSKAADIPVRVSAEPAFTGELVMRVSTTGQTRALREITILPKIGGEIVKLPIQNGSFVRKGALLMKLNDAESRLALENARDQLLGAQSEYGFMKRDFQTNTVQEGYRQIIEMARDSAQYSLASYLQEEEKKIKEMKRRYQQGEISEEAFRKAKFDYETAQIISGKKQEAVRRQKSGLTRAYLDVRKAELNLSYTEIRASFSGTVADLKVEEGQQVTAGKECFKLLDLSRIKVNLQVLENEVGLIKEGRQAEITFPAYPGELFHGRVAAINPVVDTESKTTTVTVEIPNPDKKILPGMFAYAKLEAQIFKNKFLVPKDAVLIRDQRKLLFIVRDGLAKWCYVTTGLENEKYVEILDSTLGLKPGELVITEGNYTLVHDAKVKVAKRKGAGKVS